MDPFWLRSTRKKKSTYYGVPEGAYIDLDRVFRNTILAFPRETLFGEVVVIVSGLFFEKRGEKVTVFFGFLFFFFRYLSM